MNLNGQMETDILENGVKENKMVKEQCNFMMVEYIQDNGEIICGMA